MNFNKKLLVYSSIALYSLTGGLGSERARACPTNMPLTFWGGYVDAYDQPKNVYFVFWGFGTYGDPAGFEAAALAEFGSSGLLDSFGIDSRRFYGVPSQYAGYDWSSFAYEQINPTIGANWVEDEGNLPAPDPTTGQITVDDGTIGDEADYIANYYGLDYDDIVVVLLPPNANAPDAGDCARHYVSAQYTITADVNYPGVPAGGCDLGTQQTAIQHEITEAVTDTGWNDGYVAWGQTDDAGCEIGDVCESYAFQVQVQQQSAAVRTMETQPELSNEALAAGATNGCVYGRGTTAYITGLSSGSVYVSTVAANTGLTITNGSNWGAPTGVTLTGTPTAASWGLNWVDIFVRGTNNKIYHANSLNNGGHFVSWELLNSSTAFTQSPDSVSWGAGNIQVFGVQGTNIVKNTLDYPGGWSGWTSVNKPFGVNPASKVSVASPGASSYNFSGFPQNPQTIFAAFRGSDGKVWVGHSVSGGSFTWSGFKAPATLTGDVDLSTWSPDRFDLFVLDTSGNLWDMISIDGLTLYESLSFGHPSAGGFQVGGTAAGLGDGRLLIGGRVGSNSPYVQFFNWGSGTWTSVGFPFSSPIDIAAP